MSCRKLSELQLWAYLDGELPPAERETVEHHMAACAICTARLAALRRPLFEPVMVAPPVDFSRRVMVRVALEERGALPHADLGWLEPLLHPRRLAVASTVAPVTALVNVALAGAMLALPAVEAAGTGSSVPIANSMMLAMRQALLPLAPFFRQWAWFVLGLGMLVAVFMPAVRALALRLHQRV